MRKVFRILSIVLLLVTAEAFAPETNVSEATVLQGADVKSIHTPDYYDATVRAAFKRGDWEGGKRLLDEGLRKYPDVAALNELAGSYYYHKKSYDDARYYLECALRNDQENTEARQMLVNVEEETHNYSSAICYVNELLEDHPYWKGLWRRKINLFRKQNNDVEADRLLRRLCQIYPNDAQLKKDLTYRLERQADSDRKAGNKDAAISSLRELVDYDPTNEEYYLTLCNLLLQQGRIDEALDAADRGVAHIPQSGRLVTKKASILADENRYGEALSYLESEMKSHRGGQLASFYNSLQEEAARASAKADPYTLYGKVYERSHSQESLDYLLAISVSRGYDEDALYYISEARKRKGDTPDLLYKAYIVNKRMGKTQAATSLLERLYKLNPRNQEVADELSRERLRQAMSLMDNESYGEALPLLQFVTENASDSEVSEAAFRHIVSCNMEMRRYASAEKALADYEARFPHRKDIVFRHADVLNRSGRTEEALAELYKACKEETDELTRTQCANVYEETAVPYIKKLMSEGAVSKAYDQCGRLLEICPLSEEGLRYAVNASARLKRWDEYRQWVTRGREQFGGDNFYVIKLASLLSSEGQYERADELLSSRVEEYMGDSLLINANSGNSGDWARALIDRHQPDSALAILDHALVYDGENNLLLYTKGLAYEAKHEYDSAYVYQKYYKPGFEEMSSWHRHLDGLLAKGYRNGLNFEYLQGRYGEDDMITAVASVEYTRKLNTKNSMAVRANYAGREGAFPGAKKDEQQSGGTGIQLQGEWSHTLNDRWQFTVNLAAASKYFPKWMGNLRVQRTLGHDWEAEIHGGIRRIDSYQKVFRWNEDTFNEETQTWGAWGFSHWDNHRKNLFNCGIGVSKTLEPFWMNAKLDGYAMSGKLYFNLLAQTKYYMLGDGKSCIHALASVGSAPEATMIDYAMPGTFNRINTQVGLGGQYKVHRNVTLGVLGMWYTYYTQSNYRTGSETNYDEYIDTRYKNLFNIDVQVLISF